MTSGTLVYWNIDRGFGFIQPDGSDGSRENNVYCKLNRFCEYACDGGDEPAQSGWVSLPSVGFRVLFVMDRSQSDVKRAASWASQESWDLANKKILERPTYRLRERTGRIPMSRLHEKPTYRTLWEGQDVRRVRSAYPKVHYDTYDREMTAFYFEAFDGEKWERCNDPR